MKTIIIRDVRQRWPEVEAALQMEDEILITRDSKPVAKLVRVGPEGPRAPAGTPKNMPDGRKKSRAGSYGAATRRCKNRALTARSQARADDLSGYELPAKAPARETENAYSRAAHGPGTGA